MLRQSPKCIPPQNSEDCHSGPCSTSVWIWKIWVDAEHEQLVFSHSAATTKQLFTHASSGAAARPESRVLAVKQLPGEHVCGCMDMTQQGSAENNSRTTPPQKSTELTPCCNLGQQKLLGNAGRVTHPQHICIVRGLSSRANLYNAGQWVESAWVERMNAACLTCLHFFFRQLLL